MKKLLLIFILLVIPLQAQTWDELLYYYSDDEVVYEAEAQAYFAAMTTPLSDEQKTRVNTFVRMLKDSLSITSLSQKFDVMYLFANETSEAGLRNLIKRSHDATAVNSPTFTQWEGFRGNGTTSYLNTNYNPFSQGVRYTLNSGSIGTYSLDSVSGSGLRHLLGAEQVNTGDSTRTRIQATNPSTTNSFQNANGAFITNLTPYGSITVSRESATSLKLYQNQNLVKTASTGDALVQKVLNLNYYICTTNSNGSPSATGYLGRISFSFIGAGLSDTEVRKVYNCIQWYMTQLNKQV